MKKTAGIVSLFLLLLLCACSNHGTPDDTELTAPDKVISFSDDLGRQISIQQPQRVAAMIGSFADIWCLAGGKDVLVAAADDAWTSFDLSLDENTANLGAVKEPNLEVLFSAEPDFILASCNTQADLDLLDTFEQANIPAAYFDIQSLDDYLNMLKICCTITGKSENYSIYGELVKQQSDLAIAKQDDSHPTVLCIRATGSSCKVKGSTNNVLGEMLDDLGCVNIADSDNSLLENLSLEAIIVSDPDFVFAVLQGSDPDDAYTMLEQTLLSNPAWSQLRAVQNGHFYTLEHALYNIKPNARWGEAYEKLANILYQQ